MVVACDVRSGRQGAVSCAVWRFTMLHIVTALRRLWEVIGVLDVLCARARHVERVAAVGIVGLSCYHRRRRRQFAKTSCD